MGEFRRNVSRCHHHVGHISRRFEFASPAVEVIVLAIVANDAHERQTLHDEDVDRSVGCLVASHRVDKLVLLQSHFDGFAVNLVHGFTDRVELCLSQQSVGFVASDKSGVRTVGDGVVQSRTQRFVFLFV